MKASSLLCINRRHLWDSKQKESVWGRGRDCFPCNAWVVPCSPLICVSQLEEVQWLLRMLFSKYNRKGRNTGQSKWDVMETGLSTQMRQMWHQTLALLTLQGSNFANFGLLLFKIIFTGIQMYFGIQDNSEFTGVI